jgi:vancomycin resistance protein YoaR
MKIAARDPRWKVAATVGHEAQRAFNEELKQACDGDIEAALNETVKAMQDKIAEMPYQLVRYKPMSMMQEEYVAQVEQALHNWYRPIMRMLGK